VVFRGSSVLETESNVAAGMLNIPDVDPCLGHTNMNDEQPETLQSINSAVIMDQINLIDRKSRSVCLV